MKILILAGGLGTRISEETENKPKPMVLIDSLPIIHHLMRIFAFQGFCEFVVATGYKHEIIEEWVQRVKNSDLMHFSDGYPNTLHSQNFLTEPNWKITCVNTGLHTQTGGRIAKIMNLFPGERFLVTYGDGLGNISVESLLDFHNRHGKLATVTAVHPPARFGYLNIQNGIVKLFGEKNLDFSGWINGGFFVLEPGVLNFIHNDLEAFETGALPRLVDIGQLMAYEHQGFWKPMDTLREKDELSILAKLSPQPWLDF